MLSTEKPEQFENPTEIVGCFVECQGKILLLRRQDHKEHPDHFGPPGGKVDPEDADLVHAIQREIFEETGLKIDLEKLKFVITFYVKYPKKDFLYHQYRVVFQEFPQIVVNEKEHKGYEWMTPAEALQVPLIHDEEHCIEYVYGIQ
jgi:8-oxo-dGTP pyrophosphatase MutT (NUDIX family)